MMNPFQKAVTRSYGGGDYRGLAESPKGVQLAEKTDDSLLKFLIRELADDGEPMTKAQATRRIESGIEDLMTALREVNAIP